MEWNEEQTAVLHYPGKYLRIYGGPAAGKSLLISALANEYSKREKGGVYILCRSRDETDRMTQRMYRLAGNTPVNIETFRSFADRIAGGLRAIITPFQERLILTDILSAIPEGHYLYPAGKSYQLSEELADFLRIIRLNYITPDILPSQGDELTIGLKRIYTELEDKIRTANLMTEPQLMKFAADHAPDDVKAILVDEAQDLELPAYEFIRKIGGRGASIVLAGDLYQNIHRYQGADPDFLREKFPIDFPLARTIHLKRSYRAGSLRISTANKMFGSGFEQFRPEPHNGNEELYLHDFHDPQHEALGIAGLIEMLIRRNGYAPEDIAVILRSPRRGSAGLRRALQLRNIQVNGGEAPFLTPSAWDLIKSASACDNSEDILLKLPSFLSDIIEKHHSSEIMLEPLSGLRKLFEEAAAVMPHWKSYKIAAAVKEEFLRQPFRREKGGVSIMS
nr:ATP-dependent helicase [FCB group bacterium]